MSETEKRGTVKAILIMVFSMFMSRGLGFIRTAVLAGQAGTGTDADAYAFAFLLPDLLNQILAGGVLSVTFIPLFQSLDGDKKAQNRFFSNLFWIGTTIFSLFIVVSYYFTPQLITQIAGDNITESGSLALTIKLTRIILPAQLFFFWGALLNGSQYANKKFFLPSLTPVMYNLGIILGGVFLSPYIGIEGFTWGVVVGAFVGNVILPSFGSFRTGLRLQLHIEPKSALLKEWIIKTLPLIFTLGLAYSNETMARIFGSRSPEGEGALAALNYAYRLFMIFVGIFGQAFAAGIYPFLSKMANENRYDSMEKSLFSVLEKTAIFTILSSALLFVVRYDVVAILYERGEFTGESTIITANALVAYLPGMFFFSAVLLINRLFFAMKATYTTLIISLITLGITIPLYSTVGISLGVTGIGLMGSLAAILSFSLLLFRWKQIYKESNVKSFLFKIGHIIIVSIVAGGVAFGIQQLPLPDESTLLARIIRVSVISVPPLGLALVYFDRVKLLSLRSLLKRNRG